MGKTRKKHNWKARQQVETQIDRSEEKKLDVHIEGYEKDPIYGEDESNIIALPARKRNTKVLTSEVPRVKPLSKKQRKKLEKIVERKQKKAKRADILEKLAGVQATEAETALLTSTTEVYSGRYKRKLVIESTPSGHVTVNAISGSNKKPRHPRKEEEEEEEEESSSEESSEEEEEEEKEEEKEIEEKEDEEDNETSTQVENEAGTKTTKLELTEGTSEGTSTHKTFHVPVERVEEVQEGRLKLPILGEEQGVMEAINSNPVVIICGETGSGKTTQVPQFLYEAGYAHGGGIIAVTEPRRVAAISMSKRVAHEMNLTTRAVSYQIRYEGNVTPDTKIKFLTDGVLLKEVQQDFLLTKYSVVVVDEAHERSVYTDILIGLLSRIVPLRNKKGKPLKLIIMSATLRVEDFTENKRLFKVTPPVIKVESRQFPVTVHFNKRTPIDNYMGEAYKKVCKIHRMLPPGGILVFVTGQGEVHSLCAKLRRAFPFNKYKEKEKIEEEQDKEEMDNQRLPKIKLEDYSVRPLDEEAELAEEEVEGAGGGEDEDMSDDLEGEASEGEDTVTRASAHETPLYVLPLYSLLSSDRQAKVFEPPPEGSRLCIVATNVAETSLTIPNVKYVVDTGKVKTKFYDKVTGVSTFKVTWTSQASANQRSGRAGRTGPGHSYRLYSSAVFKDDFELFAPAEIKQRPVDDLLLQMKAMSIDKVANFPFPTPPDTEALLAAEELLVSLGALETPARPARLKDARKAKADPCSKITPLGRAMASFPVAPRYGKMLSLGDQHHLLPYVVVIVAALSVPELFNDTHPLVGTEEEKEQQKQMKQKTVAMRKTWAGSGHSLKLGDLMVLLKAVGACEYAGGSMEFCNKYGIRYKAMVEIRKLRAQLTNSVNSVIAGADLILDPKMAPPNDTQARLLRQIVLAGLGDHIARKIPQLPSTSADAKKLKHAYQTMLLEDPAFIHPTSVLFKQDPEYVVYQQIDETSKLYMKGVSAVEVDWLPLFIPSRCRFSKPAEDPPPRYNPASGNVLCHMGGTFGPHFWPLPQVELEFPNNLDKYKWYARALLEGSVCETLKEFVPSLLSSPSIMNKSWAKLQTRTETLLKSLLAEEVCSDERLKAVWKKNPKYLLNAYKEWLPQVLHQQVIGLWPPL